MKLWSLILLLEVCFPHWTTSTRMRSRNYVLDIHNGTLISVKTTVKSRHINLSSQRIERIAENAFDKLVHIETLNLSNNTLKSLPPLIFSNLSNLEKLSLAENAISNFNRTFVGLNNLKRLNISNNHIHALESRDLIGLKKSTEIIIKGNSLMMLTVRDQQNSPVLKIQSFWEQAIDRINKKALSEAFAVKFCMTDDGTVESVEELKQDETLGNCRKANVFRGYSVDLKYRRIKKFKRGWYKLPFDFISEIDLSRNDITDITAEVLNDLPSPMFVDLSLNNIRIIKRNIIENAHCIGLRLQNNAPLTIEDGAFQKLCLTTLDCRMTRLSNLSFIRTLPVTIEELVLDINRFSGIPSNLFRGLTNLKSISLAHNDLKIIEVGTFEDQKNLSFIDLSGNKFKKITQDTFSALRHLHGFDLRLLNNKINSIEEGSFSNLNMRMLDLGSNKITDESIAKGAFNMCTLNGLGLSWNEIKNFNAETLYGISGSYYIDVYKNPIRTIKNFLN